MLRNPLRAGLLLAALLLPLAASAAAPLRNAEGTSAGKHAAAGVKCADCHGAAKKPAAAVGAGVCLGCHGPLDALVKKTAEVKPDNPHTSPHWGAELDCRVCHRQHEPTVNWCSHCHVNDLKVP